MLLIKNFLIDLNLNACHFGVPILKKMEEVERVDQPMFDMKQLSIKGFHPSMSRPWWPYIDLLSRTFSPAEDPEYPTNESFIRLYQVPGKAGAMTIFYPP